MRPVSRKRLLLYMELRIIQLVGMFTTQQTPSKSRLMMIGTIINSGGGSSLRIFAEPLINSLFPAPHRSSVAFFS
ncbi:hypothetical protein THICB3560281 [Thiomonas sp. CB3]|nr:hypothetical protein THICB3560281 [Thiomonas sp. CB3]